MQHTYLLRKAVLDRVPELEITAQEFDAIKNARNALLNALAIEQKYEILVSNFLAFEKQMLDITITHLIRSSFSYSKASDTISALNIALVNLLTATRLYLDQMPKNIGIFKSDTTDTVAILKEKCASEYDTRFEYRYMEALRNYVQHAGLPIDSVRNAERRNPDNNIEMCLQVFAHKTSVKDDQQFKKAVLNEMPDKVDLAKTTRQYIESISSIHVCIRETISESVNAARMTIETARHRYAKIHEGPLIALAAINRNDGKEVASVPLLLDWDDTRIELQERNKRLIKLNERFVTTRAWD